MQELGTRRSAQPRIGADLAAQLWQCTEDRQTWNDFCQVGVRIGRGPKRLWWRKLKMVHGWRLPSRSF